MYKPAFLVLLTCLLTCPGSPQQAPRIELNYFPAIPKVIDGCAGVYTYDSTSLKKEKYILITNLQKLAMIRVGGKTISLQQVSNSQPAKLTHKDVYKGSNFTIIVILKEVRQTGDEQTYETGTIEIKYGGTDVIYKIHGESGC
jgi:hypothetical protein